MTAINATAQCTVHKVGRWYNRRRHVITLYVDDVNTGLHWHVKRREVASMIETAVDNCAELLEHYGLMDAVYARVEAEGMGLPALGSKIKLAGDLGKVKGGLIGTVTAVDPMLEVAEEHRYPVTAAFLIKGETVEIALNTSEFEKVNA